MLEAEKQKLQRYVNQIAQLQTEKKDKDDEINEAVAQAAEACGKDKKTIKALANDARSNEMERAARRIQEEELDACRLALGFLANLPLGEAATAAVAANGKVDGKKPGKRSGPKPTHETGTEAH